MTPLDTGGEDSSVYDGCPCFSLSPEQCEALGIKDDIKAGQKIGLTAIAMVMNKTESVDTDGDDDGPEVYVTLKITDLEVGGTKSPGKGLYKD